jgi:iron-sulfur cluster repair protein YtfE (RIC family)
VSSPDDTDHQDAGDAFAERAQVAASRQTEAERRAAVTYAMLAIYHELRRNDLAAKIEVLTEQVGKIATLQGQRADIESGLAETIRELKTDMTAIKFAVGGEGS